MSLIFNEMLFLQRISEQGVSINKSCSINKFSITPTATSNFPQKNKTKQQFSIYEQIWELLNCGYRD